MRLLNNLHSFSNEVRPIRQLFNPSGLRHHLHDHITSFHLKPRDLKNKRIKSNLIPHLHQVHDGLGSFKEQIGMQVTLVN
jgi:hypothetical protein